jgi:hypothetical protein
MSLTNIALLSFNFNFVVMFANRRIQMDVPKGTGAREKTI